MFYICRVEFSHAEFPPFPWGKFFLQGSSIAELLILTSDWNDQQFLAHVQGFGGCFETRAGENGFTADQALVKGALADGKEKDISVLNGLFYFPGEHMEAEIP